MNRHIQPKHGVLMCSHCFNLVGHLGSKPDMGSSWRTCRGMNIQQYPLCRLLRGESTEREPKTSLCRVGNVNICQPFECWIVFGLGTFFLAAFEFNHLVVELKSSPTGDDRSAIPCVKPAWMAWILEVC